MAEMASPIAGGINNARGMISPKAATGAVEIERQELIASVSNLVGGLNLRLDRITVQMVDLSRSLQNVSASITQNTFLERQKEAIDQERERRIAESQLREGQEALVERKIENATVAPAQKAAVKAQSSLARLMGLFSLILTGWLGPNILEGIKSISKFSVEKFNQVKNLVDKGFTGIKNVFSNITAGLSNIVGSISRTTSRVKQSISNGLFKYPVDVLRNIVQGTIDKIKGIIPGGNNPSPTTASPSTAPPQTLGSSIMSGMKSLGSALLGPPGQVAIGTGANLFSGSSFPQALAGASFGVGSLYGLSKIPFLPLPIKIGAGFLAYPMLNEMGQNAFSNITSGASSFGGGLDLSSLFSSPDANQSSTASVTPATIQTTPPSSTVRAQTIGPAPEAQTNVVVTSADQQAQEVPTTTNPIANTIPNIPSSNSDNFYVYYSMANYNVVI